MNSEIDSLLTTTSAISAETDLMLAVRLAREAGELLLALQTQALQDGTPAAELKSLGDQCAQDYLAASLADKRPQDHVLSEEGADNQRRTAAQRVWIIDPLDGTREFSEGRTDWAVHVALWVSGRLQVGAVALPGLGKTLGSAPQQTAPQRQPGPLRFAVSRTRASNLVTELASRFDAELIPMGSAGFKAAAVIEGVVDAYVHSGGQYEWDSAAPVAVARSRGLHASRIDGSELLYNRADPYLPDLLLCRPDLATEMLDGIRKIGGTIAQTKKN